MNELITRAATLDDLPVLAELFDQYRHFYGQPADRKLAEKFLWKRMASGTSQIFLTIEVNTGRRLGFVQLYPSFSSIAARNIWILNDLYVAADARRRGVGTSLLQAARDFAIETKAARLVLSTASENDAARKLYESLGWKRDEVFLHYQLDLTE